MEFYCDGSRISYKNDSIIGWGCCNEYGFFSGGSLLGGTNVNAEMFAIESCLKKLATYNFTYMLGVKDVVIVTDSKTSIQIIHGYVKNQEEFDLKMLNYKLADSIVRLIKKLVERGMTVVFKHVDGHEKNIGNNFADYIATEKSRQLKEKLEAYKV